MGDGSAQEERQKLKREGAKGLGVVLVLILLMMWLAGTFVSKVEPGAAASKPRPAKVTTWKVKSQMYPLIISQVGSVSAKSVAEVSAKAMAQVKEIPVQPGDNVVGGNEEGGSPTILARLDDREIQARLRQALSQVAAMDRAMEAAQAKVGAARAQMLASRANKGKAISDYRRYQDLYRNQAATGQQLEHSRAQKDVAEAQDSAAAKDVMAAQNDVERIKAQREQAQAAAAEARVMLSYTVIQAPFTGKLVKKMVDVGDMAIPGHPLFLVETSSTPELHAFVSESLLPYLKVGQEMTVRVDALSRTLKGNLREVVPKSDPSTRTVMVKVSLPVHPDFVNGLFGQLEVPTGSYETLVIPFEAVREVGQLSLVNVLNPEGYPERRFVTLGERHGELVEVLSGLKKDEEVVTE
jgi:multidrug resistance efflux pump